MASNTQTNSSEDPAEQDEETFDLRYVSENQIACPGTDLEEMLNFDDRVGPALYQRLGLTPHRDEGEDFLYNTFEEVDIEGYYMITFPSGTDFSDFSIADALAIEPFSEARFLELPTGDEDEPCDGDCENCPQDCIGKQPID